MKIAVASEGSNVSGHFGHCSDFNIFTAENGKITHSERIQSPGHDHNLIEFLAERGVDVIISGGMGAGAREKFDAKGIRIVTGAEGAAADVYKRQTKSSALFFRSFRSFPERVPEAFHL